MPAHWWLELVLGSIHVLDRDMSRGMSRGGYRVKKSLESLSVDGWGCVPAQFVVCPEESQH